MENMPDRSDKEHLAPNRAAIAILISLGLGLAFDILFFGKLPGISFPIFIILSLVALLGWAEYQKRKPPKSALFMVPLLLFFSSMVFVRAGIFLALLNIFTSLYLLGLFVVLAYRPSLRAYDFRNYIGLMIELPLAALRKMKSMLAPLIAEQKFVAKHKNLPHVVRGVLIALPVLLIFVGLFSSADLVFRHYVGDLFSFRISGDLFWRSFWMLLVAAMFVGLLGLVSQRQEAAEGAAEAPAGRGKEMIEVTILFGSLNALFLSFILIQFAYLFGGAANVAGDGFTYAEYARKGFFELIAAAGLSLVLILAAEKVLLKGSSQHGKRFKWLSALLIAQVMIVMISAVKRLHLYESAYGFTSLRVLSYIFITWLAVVFAVLLYKILTGQRESMLAFAVFVSVMAALVFINFLNVDGFVARKNIERYHATGKLDAQYLTSLSADAIVPVSGLLDDKNPAIVTSVADSLFVARRDLQSMDDGWQSANVTRSAALKVLDSRSQLLDKYGKNLPEASD